MLCLCSSSTPYSTGPGECQQHGGEGEKNSEEIDGKKRKEMQVCVREQVDLMIKLSRPGLRQKVMESRDSELTLDFIIKTVNYVMKSCLRA